jgi:ketosteroid isomerase-like protein
MKKSRRAAAILAGSISPSPPTPPSALEIRDLRAASNHAIANGDLSAVSASLADDFVVIIGDGTLLTREAYLEAFAHIFTQPIPIRYERVAATIQLSASLPLAAEHGHWIGSLPDGQVLFTGTYMAMWRHTDPGWKLRSELFVSLTYADPASSDA